MMQSLLFALMIVPVVVGVLCFLIPWSKVRNALVVLLSLFVISGGITLVTLTQQLDTAGNLWLVELPHWGEMLGSGLEMAVILTILIIALRIRNVWIGIFSVLQAIFVIWGHFLPADKAVEAASFVAFKVDNLTRLMLLVTSVVGAAILIFSISYMREHAHHVPEGDRSLKRFYFFFCSFIGFMIGLVVSEQLTFFSLFWEATTLCSYALIGQDGGEARRVNATRALFINSFGGVLLIAGIFMVKYLVKEESFSAMFEHHSVTLLPAILLCIAAFTKSALFPFQSWLLGAMVAPTPVSAMLHAATMVKAGVYLVLRMTPSYYTDSRVMMMIAFGGALSFVGGALLAGTQSNAKKVLAYSTISNLGLIVACAGVDSPLAYAAALAIIVFHAISKGLLFLCVGRIEQHIGSRDIEDMDGLLFKMPFTTCVMLIGMMSMLLPPFGMLISKWLAIESTINSPSLLIFMVLGSALTVYFWAKWIGRIQNTGYHQHVPNEVITPCMRISLGFLALLVLASGFLTIKVAGAHFLNMAKDVYKNFDGVNWRTFNDISKLPAIIIFSFIIAALVLYYFFFWRRFKKESVSLPYLGGENINISQIDPDTGIRSYDFHSVGGKVEHSVISGYYFAGIINEKVATACLNWAAYLIIIVLIGNTIVQIHN